MRKGTCISCGQGLLGKGSTLFACPHCENQIGRCGECREQAVDYACGTCGNRGP